MTNPTTNNPQNTANVNNNENSENSENSVFDQAHQRDSEGFTQPKPQQSSNWLFYAAAVTGVAAATAYTAYISNTLGNE